MRATVEKQIDLQKSLPPIKGVVKLIDVIYHGTEICFVLDSIGNPMNSVVSGFLPNGPSLAFARGIIS